VIAAIIAGGVVTLGVAMAILALALSVRGAEQRCSSALVQVAERDGQLAVNKITIDSLKRDIAFEKRRADAFDKELDQIALDGDVPGARARVLQRWQREDAAATNATGDHGEGAVHHEPAAAPQPAVEPDDDIFASRL
jgi:hypothetical protein